MIAAWMLYSAAVGVLASVAALAGDRFCGTLGLAVRPVWVGALLATLLLSMAGALRVTDGLSPAAPSAVMEADAVTSSQLSEADGVLERAVNVVRGGVDGVREGAAMLAARSYAFAARLGGGRLLLGGWLACTSALLLLLIATLLRVRRARGSWRAHRIGDVDVLVARDAGPALIGLLHPAIVVPSWLLSEPVERQQLVVAHEDEHRRGGDHALLALAAVAVCVLPWNVALWWMLVRTRLAVELDCDARVIRRGARAASYGSLLLDIAGRARVRTFAAPALADSATHLERRLIAMTETNRTPRRARTAAAGITALVLSVAACATELPTAAAIEDMDVEEVRVQGQRAGLLTLTGEDAPLYIIDGVVVDASTGRALLPDEVASVEVVKGTAATALYGERAVNGVILITTGVPVDDSQILNGVPVRVVEGRPLRKSEVEALSPRAREQLLTLRRAQSDTSVFSEDDILVTAYEVKLDPAPIAGTEPLIVLDGVVVSSSFSLNDLPREKVERIEVLKKAAARRLYDDPRAANGVIRITTKPDGSR